MSRPKHLVSAIILMLQSSFAFSVMALCVKAVSKTLPSQEIVFLRSLMGTLMVLGVLTANRISIFGRERKILLLRGLSGFAALSLNFYAISHLPLGTAVILNYTSPIFAAALAILFLKERPGPLLLGMIGTSFLGIYLLVGGKAWLHWDGAVSAGLLSALFAAVAYISIGSIKGRESPYTLIFYFTAISTLGSAFFLPTGFVCPDFKGWILLAGVAVGSFFGQIGTTIAYQRAPASLVSPFSYLTPVLSFLYGFLLLGDPVTPLSFAGAGMIIVSGSVISYFETRPASKTTR